MIRWLTDGSAIQLTRLYQPRSAPFAEMSGSELPAAAPAPSQPRLPVMVTPVIEAVAEENMARKRGVLFRPLTCLHVSKTTSPTPAKLLAAPVQAFVYERCPDQYGPLFTDILLPPSYMSRPMPPWSI